MVIFLRILPVEFFDIRFIGDGRYIYRMQSEIEKKKVDNAQFSVFLV